MTLRRLVRTSLFLAPLGAFVIAACARQANQAQPSTVIIQDNPKAKVAAIGDEVIHASELNASVKDEMKDFERTFVKARYDAQRQALEALIFRKLVEREAQKTGVTAEAYLQTQVEDKVPAVSEADAQAFYDTHPDKMGGLPFELLKDKLIDFLQTERKSQAIVAFHEDMKRRANVHIFLAAPDEPRVKVSSAGPSRGPETAEVTIVEFSDFQCPHCGEAQRTLDELLMQYDGKVRMVFRHFPLPFHKNAQKAAEASACADAQGQFWALHDYMFKHQDTLDAVTLKKAARNVGLDGARFDRCLDSGEMAGVVDASVKAAKAAGVSGTPHFFVNGRPVEGAQSVEKFKEVIDAEIKAGKTVKR